LCPTRRSSDLFGGLDTVAAQEEQAPIAFGGCFRQRRREAGGIGITALPASQPLVACALEVGFLQRLLVKVFERSRQRRKCLVFVHAGLEHGTEEHITRVAQRGAEAERL